jgi:hypothetical protein
MYSPITDNPENTQIRNKILQNYSTFTAAHQHPKELD